MASKQIKASAPGKVILFGEHAVVYGQPAIAAPVTQVKATATVKPAKAGTGLVLVASDLKQTIALAEAAPDEPLAAAARAALAHLGAAPPDATLTIESTIPIASGLGSGAAVSTAIVRALASFLGRKLKPAKISEIVFEVEKIHHGTPSGIDNTVVAFEQPIYFKRDQPTEHVVVGEPFTLTIGDTGKASPTRKVVTRVRRSREKAPARYDALFDQIGDIVSQARLAIKDGDVGALGPLMDENHELLIEVGVSSAQLNDLVEAARFGGAVGAKLSGAGQGGNVIALLENHDDAEDVEEALREAGAKRVIVTRIGES